MFRTLYEHGFIVEQTTLGAFSASTGHTLPDRYIEGTCPICGFTDARGDQCDNCGNQLDPIDLIDPRSKIDGDAAGLPGDDAPLPRPPRVRASSSATGSRARRTGGRTSGDFSLQLLDELQAAADHARPRLGRPRARRGLRGARRQADLRLVRRGHRLPVGVRSSGPRTAATPDAWRDWWQNPEARHFYFMGKDNIVFHTVIWPSQLIGYGDGRRARGREGGARAALRHRRERVPDDGGQAVLARAAASSIYVGDFLDRYDPDALRYYLTAAGPETQDTDFTWAEFVRRNNDELVATWGNLVNRTLHERVQELRRGARARRAAPTRTTR